ncbi:MAG TPA: hypothetical protein VFW31_07600 [Candidatus Angelobacter sp.]|nr:hypothetical protein [Candidatus Angelobacter sp.]
MGGTKVDISAAWRLKAILPWPGAILTTEKAKNGFVTDTRG